MKKIIFSSALFILLSPIAMAQKHKTVAQDIYLQTKAANDASLQGHIEKNADKICAVYTEDAIILPPNTAVPIQGKKSIYDYYIEGFKTGTSLKISTTNISYEVIDKNHAHEVGVYSILYKANDSDQEVEIKGKMLIVWERNKKGEWKIKLDMWH